ncbi:MAG TPA: GGDEF domain-containing protein [Rubrivivax sp.]|nr:GGDEF domain-containing protein [Rubrivivax sp.]
MSRVVEHLAELTGYRDRDVLDVSLVAAMQDLLQPISVAIYRNVDDHVGQQHWLTRARLGPGDTTATADPLWSELSSLPLLVSHPARHACLLRQETITVGPAGDAPAMTYFALGGDREAVGVLEVATPKALGTAERKLVSSMLRIYRNFQGLLDYSERDTLTGLLNRKTFDESFLRIAIPDVPPRHDDAGHEPRRPAATSTSWLGVIDIDHFKHVNDTYGHLIGDEVLLLLSRLMRSSFRFHDQLYRFGGEEFVVLMRCGNADDALLAMERLRGNVAKYSFPRVGNITVSVGFTELRPGDTPSAAFERADKAVYFAKQNGRDRVCHHATLVAEGKLADDTRDSDVELF